MNGVFPVPGGGSGICHIAQTSFILKKIPKLSICLSLSNYCPISLFHPSSQTSAEFCALKFSISVAPASSLTHQPLASIPAC